MNYAANVSGGGNHAYHDGCGNKGGMGTGAILVLFILLVLLTRVLCC